MAVCGTAEDSTLGVADTRRWCSCVFSPTQITPGSHKEDGGEFLKNEFFNDVVEGEENFTGAGETLP